MRAVHYFLVAVVATTSMGCGGSGEYRRTAGPYAARGPDCEYQVIRNRVIEPYEEIGIIDIDAFTPQQMPDNEKAFRRVVGKTVCAAGGDAVIPALDIYGHWVIGTVIRFNPPQCHDCGGDRAMPGGDASAGSATSTSNDTSKGESG